MAEGNNNSYIVVRTNIAIIDNRDNYPKTELYFSSCVNGLCKTITTDESGVSKEVEVMTIPVESIIEIINI